MQDTGHNHSHANRRVAELEGELAVARERIKELETKLETDPLLNILNRRGFERELKRALVYANRYRTSVAVLYVDLNNYKDVVDHHTHVAGDELLIAVAGAIVADHRASDIVARFGGDKFIILMWNLNEADARMKAKALELEIAGLEVRYANEILRSTASTGLTMLKRFDCAENVMARAELDMRSRKQQRQPQTAAFDASQLVVDAHQAA